ncbi:MAG: hypothetical protein ACXWKP_14915 [Bradyrhizobium sp.]
MRKQLLAGAMAVALAAGMTTSAMAFDRGGDGSFAARNGSRFAGIRGFSGYRHGWSGHRFVGGHDGWSYGPTYYEGVAPFGRLVGPATGGPTFFVR